MGSQTTKLQVFAACHLPGQFLKTASNDTLVWNTPADLPESAGSAEVVAATAAQTPPARQAGAQDDVSLQQTTQK